MNVAVVHPGTQHSWQTAYALQQLGRLEFYATSIFYQPDRWPYRIERYLPKSLGERLGREFRRFSHGGLNPDLVRTSGVWEWLERIARRQGYRDLAARLDRIGNRRIADDLERMLGGPKPFALWTYDNVAGNLFPTAKAHGRACILDRTIGDWRAYNEVMQAVFEDYPEFFPKPDFRMDQQRIEQNQAEYEQADVILAGSPFSAETVAQHGGAAIAGKLRVLPYCYDELLFADAPPRPPRPKNEPLRFLFAGQAGVRKGVHLALKAMERIAPEAASLTIVGDLQVPAQTYARYADRVTHIPTVARRGMVDLMREADVLIFPTYFEGAGIVLYEALASGMGIIQSRNADIAVTADTGILMPDITEEALYEAMMQAIENRDLVEQWRANAPAAAHRYSFANYRGNIAKLLGDMGI